MRRSTFRRPSGCGGYTGCLVLLFAALRLFAADIRDGPVAAPDRSLERVPELVPFPTTLLPGIYLLGNLAPSAVYVVATGEGLVLVDSGLLSDASGVKAQMRSLNLDWTQIRAVLLTHAHADHSGGAEHLRTAAGARVYAGEGDAAVLRAGGPAEAFFSAFELPGGQLHRTTVDVALKGGESLAFGDVRFRVLATPGHTPGSLCYLMERADLRVLFGGDVISMLRGDEKSHERIWRPLGTYSAYMPPRYRGDAQTYAASLRSLRALPVPDLVLPGHPRADRIPQNPRLSRKQWEDMLDQGIAEMTTLQAHYERDGRNFLDGDPKSLLPGLDYLGDFQGAAVYSFAVGSKRFLVDAPGGPGLFSFVKGRLRGLGRKPEEPQVVLLTSCDASQRAGLGELIDGCHPEVVVSSAGLRTLESRVSGRDGHPRGGRMAGSRGVPNHADPDARAGRGTDRLSPAMGRQDRAVLRRIPIKYNPRTDADLFAEISTSRDVALDYLMSVYGLGDPIPDLWLPAVPVDGQNANLYDRDWPDILADNYRIGYRRLKLRR